MSDNYDQHVNNAGGNGGRFITKRSVQLPDGSYADAVVLLDGGGGVGGYRASAQFTPAAASHAAGDSNGVAAEFAWVDRDGNPPPEGAHLIITSATLLVAGGTAEASAWRTYQFSVTPPSALADDAPFALASGDRASHLGYVDLGTPVDLGDSLWVETHGINKQMKLAGTSSWGYLVNLTTVTPAAVARTVTLHAILA